MDKKYDRQFLGHPRGLSTLFFTELWERFSYYGMRAILLFYMIDRMANGGLQLSQSTGASIMAIYGSLVYMSSVLGGFISDRILGPRRTILYGGILIMLGHIVLAMPFKMIGLLFSILLITLGTGFLKPNVSDMVGSLYPPTDPRRDAGFTIYYMGINIGALAAPLIVGWLGQTYNYHLGFSLAAVGMFFGLLQYYIDGRKYLNHIGLQPTDPLDAAGYSSLRKRVLIAFGVLVIVVAGMAATKMLTIKNVILLITIIGVLLPVYYFTMILRSPKVTAVERSRIVAYIMLFLVSIIFWAIFEQGSIVLALFASTQTQLHWMGLHIQASQFQSVNAFYCIIYTPVFAILWTKMGNHQPASSRKFGIGSIFAGSSFLWMTIPVLLFGVTAKVSPLWLIGSWALLEIGEMLISPIGLSLTTKLAPKAFQAQMMSVWFLSEAAAQAINAQIVRFYTPGTEVQYFTVIGGIAIIAGILLILFTPKMKQLMHGIS